jgi:hypothetical protein
MVLARCLVVLACCVGCGEPALAPTTVASPWVAQSLEKDPDVVIAIDVHAARADPFYGRLVTAVMDDTPLPYDAFLGARFIDVFGVAHGVRGRKTVFTAAVFGGGELPADLERCITRDAAEKVTVESRDGVWILSNGKSAPATPSAVTMDSGAILEAWVGPGAVDLALEKRAPEMWQHLHAMRIQLRGGDTPGMVIDARFETSVDAEHAEYDVARAERMLQRSIGDDDKEAAPLLLEQLAQIHVSRSGADLQMTYRMTPALTAYVSRMIDGSRRHRTRHGCDPITDSAP